jgi:transposase-like protein
LDRQLAEQLLEQARSQGVQLVGPDGLLSKVTKTVLESAVLESALEAEMDSHLGYERNSPAGRGSGNSRNGKGGKTVMTDVGPVTLEVPRDRNGTFAPQIVAKRARRLDGFNQPGNRQSIISLYAKGLTTGDIQAHLLQVYGAEVSRDLISRVTDAVSEELSAWQSRPLDRGRFLPVVANPEGAGFGCRGTRRTRCRRRSSVATSS